MKLHLLKSSHVKSSREKLLLGISLFLLAMFAAPASAQATQPANLPLEYRANQAFNQGRYPIALPLLQELAGTLIDSPEKLGPVVERIHVCKTAIAAVAKMPPAEATPPAPTAAFVPQRTIHSAPRPGEVLDLAIKELGNFDYDPDIGGTIPKDVQQLSGATIRTRGYMIAMDEAQNIHEFALVPSLMNCCLGRPPQVQHTIIVHLAKGKALLDYSPGILEVVGKLTVQEKADEGYIVSIFDIDATSVKVVPQ